jgi:hypothetical protein
MTAMPIGGAALCERAAAVAGRPYGGNVTVSAVPMGCVWYSAGGSFYFNRGEQKAGHASAQPVCAGAPPSSQQQQQPSAIVCRCG